MTETNEPNARTIQTIPIEWDWDMDATTISLGFSDGPFTEVALKGRCKRCWGALRGRTDQRRAVTGIRCLICGKLLGGSAAAAEDRRTSKESHLNAMNMRWGHQPKYGDGPFVQKVFPRLDRLSEQELLGRVSLVSTFDPPVVTTFDPPLARPLTARAGTAPWYQRASVASITSSLAVPASRDRCGESRCR